MKEPGAGPPVRTPDAAGGRPRGAPRHPRALRLGGAAHRQAVPADPPVVGGADRRASSRPIAWLHGAPRRPRLAGGRDDHRHRPRGGDRTGYRAGDERDPLARGPRPLVAGGHHKFPDPPHQLTDLPLVGPTIDQTWRSGVVEPRGLRRPLRTRADRAGRMAAPGHRRARRQRRRHSRRGGGRGLPLRSGAAPRRGAARRRRADHRPPPRHRLPRPRRGDDPQRRARDHRRRPRAVAADRPRPHHRRGAGRRASLAGGADARHRAGRRLSDPGPRS